MKIIDLKSYFEEMWEMQRNALRERGASASSEVYYNYTYKLMNFSFSQEKNNFNKIVQQVGRYETGFLFGIAKSCAQSSVRVNNATRIKYGLMALILENGHEDYRESLMRLSLLDNSARRLNYDLCEVWNQLKVKCPEFIFPYFDAYFKRGGISIMEMGGYYESTDKDGEFVYKRNW